MKIFYIKKYLKHLKMWLRCDITFNDGYTMAFLESLNLIFS